MVKDNVIVLYREIDFPPEELPAAQKYFPCVHSRVQFRNGDLVIPRYCALPYYSELEQDVIQQGAKLLNTYEQHRFVADIQNWYSYLQNITPETWFRLEDIPDKGPFFLKGETNSKKFLFSSHCYAQNKKDAIQVYLRLTEDSLISQQKICIRRFIPLKTYFTAPHNLPITEEFRFFILDGEILTGAYYWSSHVEDFQEEGIPLPDVKEVPQDFLDKIVKIVSPNIRFWVMDVARTQQGDWILIELNDGLMSGLSENIPDVLYSKMKNLLNK